jgi:GAF domain-containing protein
LGIEPLRKKETFGLEDLGLLDATPHKSHDTIVGLCAGALGVTDATIVAFIVFDDCASRLFIRALVGDTPLNSGEVHGRAEASVSSHIRDTSEPVAISNLALRPDTLQSTERQVLGAAAYLGAPVHGPMGETLGVLCAMRPTEHHWTRHQRKVLCDFAFLLSEQILLRAALETVKLMARERPPQPSDLCSRN